MRAPLLPGFVTRNFQLKLLATLLSLVTWAGVVYAANPPGERVIKVAVPQDPTSLPAGFVLTEHVDDLAVRIDGTADHLNAFSTSSIVLRVHYEVIHDAGTFDVPFDFTNNDRNVDAQPEQPTVQVTVDRLGSATRPVQVVINPAPPPGYLTSTVQTTPQVVTVTGPAKLLLGIQPKVQIDLSNQKANFEEDLTVFLYDAGGHRRDDVNASPPTVRVLITVVGVSTQRVTAVVPPIQGSVAPGYEIASVTVSPLTVTLTGPQDILNGLDFVPTDTIFVTGLTATRSFTVSVRTPAGVGPSPNMVTVRVEVVPLPAASPTPSPTPTGGAAPPTR